MPPLSEPVARYHNLLEHDGYRDLGWAEQLQEQMRLCNLAESGRLLAPVLRPHFVTARQLENLTRVSEQLAAILSQVEALALESRTLLERLHMLPAEKMLAAIPSGSSRFTVTSRLNLRLQNGSLSMRGVDTCKAAGLAYSDCLSDLFLDLPIVKEFKRGNYKLSKLGGVKQLRSALLQAWKEFGGTDQPNIAVIEAVQPSAGGEARLLVEMLARLGSPARLVSPERLEYTNGRLTSEGIRIDIGFRRLLTRELLVRSDLSHPLLRAYRDGAVCLVNGFRSEVAQRRSLFDLLTDETVTSRLSSAEHKLIRTFVPWTRVVSQRKTQYKGEEIDLPEFILRSQEHLVLLPNEDESGRHSFVGAEITATAWERALRLALQAPYVVQERSHAAREMFPVFAYGELKMKEADVCVHPHVFNGQVQGASASLEAAAPAMQSPFAIAPVFLLEEK